MKKKVFMVMPFTNDISKKAYKYSIKKVCENHDLEIRKADEIFSTNPIYDDIIKEINDASIIIVDISNNNPNVFYELGMAYTLKQNQTIIITNDEINKTPFDISHFRIIKYEDSIEGKENLEKHLDLTLNTLLSDYKTLNKSEYEMVINILSSSDNYRQLAFILGIRDYEGLVTINSKYHMEFSESKDRTGSVIEPVKNDIGLYLTLNYIKNENDIITITEEGRAFAEYVELNGIKCHIFNSQRFEEGYESIIEITKKEIERSKKKKNK